MTTLCRLPRVKGCRWNQLKVWHQAKSKDMANGWITHNDGDQMDGNMGLTGVCVDCVCFESTNYNHTITITHMKPVSVPLSLDAKKKKHAAGKTQQIENWWRGDGQSEDWASDFFCLCVHTQYCRAVRCMTQDAHDWPSQYRTCFRIHIFRHFPMSTSYPDSQKTAAIGWVRLIILTPNT